MKIIDPHQHFWDLKQNYHPWLADKPVPFRYGDYTALQQNYGPDDYRRDAAAFDIVGTVHVEAEWDPSDPIGETEWIAALRLETGLPTAMVAQAWLDRDGVEAVLDAHASQTFIKGVRHKPAAASAPDRVIPNAPGSMGDPAFRRGARLLAKRELSFDLQTPWWHLEDAVRLAAATPDLKIILNHTGLPSDRSPAALDGWRRAMRLLARETDAAVKISGLGQPGRPWTVADNRPVVRETIDIFGADRCMFASNFPVDSLVASFREIYDGFRAIVADLDATTQWALFHDTAIQVYRLDHSLSPSSEETPSS